MLLRCLLGCTAPYISGLVQLCACIDQDAPRKLACSNTLTQSSCKAFSDRLQQGFMLLCLNSYFIKELRQHLLPPSLPALTVRKIRSSALRFQVTVNWGNTSLTPSFLSDHHHAAWCLQVCLKSKHKAASLNEWIFRIRKGCASWKGCW